VAARTSLVVVESPTKVKTIQKYLDRGFVVKASLGHLKDLPKSKLGIDIKKSFAPQYVPVRAKAKTLEDLKRAGKKAKALYVATDPDREGEAIGWHIAQELGLPPERVYRVLFNEITEKAVKAAFKDPGRIDQKRVDAQQARRVLDRLVGYKISPLLWERVRRGLSAGRVQSVAVRLICEREREIRTFVPQEYWSLHAYLAAAVPPEFVATLREKGGEKIVPSTEAETQAIVAELEGLPFVVKDVDRGERRKNPSPPFITSTLQQDAARKLRFSASKTMMVAQQLYEGIEVQGEGPVGFITYVPVFGKRPGYLHDLTRKQPDAPTGTMELINSVAIERMRDQGVPYLHFGFTPFIVDGPEPASASRLMSRAVAFLARRGAMVYPAQTQVAYKLKWGPDLIETEFLAGRPLSIRAVVDLLLLTRSL